MADPDSGRKSQAHPTTSSHTPGGSEDQGHHHSMYPIRQSVLRVRGSVRLPQAGAQTDGDTPVSPLSSPWTLPSRELFRPSDPKGVERGLLLCVPPHHPPGMMFLEAQPAAICFFISVSPAASSHKALGA